MADVPTQDRSIQHFQTLTGTNTVLFQRPVNSLFLTITSTIDISFDGGTHFMNLPAGHHQFYHLPGLDEINLQGAGTVTGVGFSL